MSDKINYYQIPDKYWFRIHFVRPRFKSNIENVLLYMANECLSNTSMFMLRVQSEVSQCNKDVSWEP